MRIDVGNVAGIVCPQCGVSYPLKPSCGNIKCGSCGSEFDYITMKWNPGRINKGREKRINIVGEANCKN